MVYRPNLILGLAGLARKRAGAVMNVKTPAELVATLFDAERSLCFAASRTSPSDCIASSTEELPLCVPDCFRDAYVSGSWFLKVRVCQDLHLLRACRSSDLPDFFTLSTRVAAGQLLPFQLLELCADACGNTRPDLSNRGRGC